MKSFRFLAGSLVMIFFPLAASAAEDYQLGPDSQEQAECHRGKSRSTPGPARFSKARSATTGCMCLQNTIRRSRLASWSFKTAARTPTRKAIFVCPSCSIISFTRKRCRSPSASSSIRAVSLPLSQARSHAVTAASNTTRSPINTSAS